MHVWHYNIPSGALSLCPLSSPVSGQGAACATRDFPARRRHWRPAGWRFRCFGRQCGGAGGESLSDSVGQALSRCEHTPVNRFTRICRPYTLILCFILCIILSFGHPCVCFCIALYFMYKLSIIIYYKIFFFCIVRNTSWWFGPSMAVLGFHCNITKDRKKMVIHFCFEKVILTFIGCTTNDYHFSSWSIDCNVSCALNGKTRRIVIIGHSSKTF